MELVLARTVYLSLEDLEFEKRGELGAYIHAATSRSPVIALEEKIQ